MLCLVSCVSCAAALNLILASCYGAAITNTTKEQSYDETDVYNQQHFQKAHSWSRDLPTLPETSCPQRAKLRPGASSGLYWIQVGSRPLRVFCNMAKEC